MPIVCTNTGAAKLCGSAWSTDHPVLQSHQAWHLVAKVAALSCRVTTNASWGRKKGQRHVCWSDHDYYATKKETEIKTIACCLMLVDIGWKPVYYNWHGLWIKPQHDKERHFHCLVPSGFPTVNIPQKKIKLFHALTVTPEWSKKAPHMIPISLSTILTCFATRTSPCYLI